MKKNTRIRGAEAEKIAYKFLSRHKLCLIEKNYYCRQGEIDLIMTDDLDLVFIEVRHRNKADFMQTIESIDYKKQQKIITTSQYFLLNNQHIKDYNVRYDVVIVNQNLNQPEINWIKNAFQL